MLCIFYPIYVGITYLPPTFLLITRHSAPDQIHLYHLYDIVVQNNKGY
jgi:hypothetical protein